MRDTSNILASMGRGGDSMVAHVTPGDVVIPRDVVLENPEFLTKFKKAMSDMGGDYKTHVVGSGYDSVNPQTGQPEYFFSGLKSFFRNPGKQIKQFIEDPGEQIAQTLKTGLTPVPSLQRMVGSVVDPLFGTGAYDTAFSKGASGPQAEPSLGGIEEEFTPARPEERAAPAGLLGREVGGAPFGTLDPMQQRSYLATEGAFGGGLGSDVRDYYMNLLQRNLLTEGGQMQNISDALLPVERTYLSNIGLPTGSTMGFFQALQS